MFDLDRINEIVNKFGEDVIKEMQNDLRKNKSTATSQLLNSLNYNAKVDIERIIIQFNSEDYGLYVNEGRKEGKYPNLSKLKQWCKVKGIEDKAVFPIAYKIYKFGIKPKPFLFRGLNKLKQDFMVELIKVYADEMILQIKQTFLEELKAIKK